MKHLTFCALLAMGMQTLGFSQYTMTVEATPATQEGLTTYRFYVNMSDATDRMSAVYGNDEANMFIETPEGAFNSAANTAWNASGINPAFLPVFPELADDTYATIGLTGPAATSGLAGAADPAIVEDTSQPVTPYFLTNGATNLTSTTLTGSSWYILNTAANGLPDENLQVIILQVTTAGAISGTLNYQVFPLGAGANAEYYSVPFTGAGTFGPECTNVGCTDPQACNFDPTACVPDDSCTYIAAGACDCDGNVLDAAGVCGGDCMMDADGNGVCDDVDIPGCINSSACNYNPEATVGDGSCEFPATGTCCGGGADLDEDGVCDDEELLGCTDSFACNYDASATEDDDTCEYCSCADGAYTVTVEASPAIQAGLTTYRVYVNLPNAGDFLSAVYSNVDEPMEVHAPEGVYNDPASTTWSASGINPALFVNFPNLQDDSYATIGLTTSATLLTGVEQDPSLAELDGAVATFFTQDGATDLVSNTNPGSAWFVLNGAANGYADADGRVLIMQVTTAGSINGTVNYQVFGDGDQDNDFSVTASFDGEGTFGQTNVCGCMQANACNYNPDATISDDSCEYESCNGCMDETACNYDETATIDDGTNCEYPDAGYNCDGSCIDSNMNDVCDFDEEGCTDETACNYDDMAAFEDGSCEYAEEYYDCDGMCLNDADGDGVCDELEVLGCTDEAACNYNEFATDDDGMCEYPEQYYDCFGNCLNDADGDGVCDELEVAGCTDMEACNYNELATDDDGSCLIIGESCDDGDPNTINDVVTEDCECAGEVDGVGENDMSFVMFPNPAQGELTLQINGYHTQATIQILDAAGRVVLVETNLVLQGNKVLDVSNLSSGTYNVMVSDERGVLVRRLSIQH